MSTFYEELKNISQEEILALLSSADENSVRRAIGKEEPGLDDFIRMISPAASGYLDLMAVRSKAITEKHFGKNINMYVPIYISNECSNECIYCGFNRKNKIERKTLNTEEINDELEKIKEYGFDSLLILTGEAPAKAGIEYIKKAITAARRHFAQVSLEIYPMETAGYRELVDAGATGLTIYQETYDPELYDKIHLSGRKKDFKWRLEAPDRAAQAGFRKIGLGALMGLYDWHIDAAYTMAHAKYIMKKYWRAEVSVSFPRMRGSSSAFTPYKEVTEHDLVQMIFAARIYTKFAGIALSTRESGHFRDNMIGYGITQMSAGSKTNPGGYGENGDKTDGQFEICDDRTVEEVKNAIISKGYYPVFKDWSDEFGGIKIESNS
jgi:2-iminoacetate synthase